ncbi:MAG: hypothetical protein U5L73_11885 [Rhodoferax sp.]|uniref:hypothetical protein n=1 Tax=Rhodoferax sp. TaxID=50421 RepID=UPI002ACD75E8|nr:hypothetical protein [Rhodoferax sp.]MDZ7892443.1 hypothetical protein [Rhodoferax sp.]
MTDSIILFLLPTIIVQAFFIWITYEAIGASAFSRPRWILFIGIIFMAFAALSKSILQPLANIDNSLVSSIPAAIIAIEVSTAAIGGSLVAAAIVLKAQILHNTWKLHEEENISSLKIRFTHIQKQITKLKHQRKSMSIEKYTEKLDSLIEREIDLKERTEQRAEELKKRKII